MHEFIISRLTEKGDFLKPLLQVGAGLLYFCTKSIMTNHEKYKKDIV